MVSRQLQAAEGKHSFSRSDRVDLPRRGHVRPAQGKKDIFAPTNGRVDRPRRSTSFDAAEKKSAKPHCRLYRGLSGAPAVLENHPLQESASPYRFAERSIRSSSPRVEVFCPHTPATRFDSKTPTSYCLIHRCAANENSASKIIGPCLKASDVSSDKTLQTRGGHIKDSRFGMSDALMRDATVDNIHSYVLYDSGLDETSFRTANLIVKQLMARQYHHHAAYPQRQKGGRFGCAGKRDSAPREFRSKWVRSYVHSHHWSGVVP